MVILSCVSEAKQADEVRVTPAAREYGFTLISGPERIADGRTSITVAVGREMELLAYM